MRVEKNRCVGRHGGMVLPMVLIGLAGLWLLSLSLLSLVAVSQRASHMHVEQLQAELAVQAGLESLRLRLAEICDDDALVICDAPSSSRQAALLYVVQPAVKDGQLRYQPNALYSRLEDLDDEAVLKVPVSPIRDEKAARLWTHPWLDAIRVDWLPIRNADGRMVARTAYWIEDLEGRLDPSMVGHAEEGSPRFQAMDDTPGHQRAHRLLENRALMVSPESSLAAAGIRAPLQRWKRSEDVHLAGRLRDAWFAFLEADTTVGLQSYEEQPRVPFSLGLSPLVMGQPKRNLNDFLHQPARQAVVEMAAWIQTGLPDFEDRQGGFPENYLETLAANAIDYADRDREPILIEGRCRGIDGQPFLSEVVLHLHFQGLVRDGDRWVLKWTLRLFGELWNLSSEPIEAGRARLSYEVNLRPTTVGLDGSGRPFDAEELLEDSRQSQHHLERIGGHYFSPEIEVSLRPDEYRFYEFARVDYTIDCSPQFDASGQALAEWFDLVELEQESRGLSLLWNDQEVERLQRIHRDPYGLANFRTDRNRKTAKACIPALNYGGHATMINNPGDSRMSHYLRGLPLGENAYPENVSPHRRNIRRRNIYDLDPSPYKTRHYGRVLPSEWPDGGHDSATGDFRVTTSDARFPTDPEWWPYQAVPTPRVSDAVQRLSNGGRFLRVTELGRIFDPLMWTPAYPDLAGQSGSGTHDTAELSGRLSIWQRPSMPLRRGSWPEVSWASIVSSVHGGGNTLRMGRPEHQRFDVPGMRATQLLDLFHCGHTNAQDAELQQSPTLVVAGRVNLNTASREVLRTLAYGALREDEAISRVVSPVHDTHLAFAPQVESWQATEEQLQRVADRVADGIIRARPFASASELAQIHDEQGEALFGNPALHEATDELQWSDAAAEELFARVYSAGGVRSRHFRVWLVGQSVRERGERVEVMAQTKRVVSLFVDPGERGRAGELIPENQKVRVLHERSF